MPILECVLCDEGVGENIIKSGPNLRGDVKNAAFLAAAGIDCAILANNHLGDLGEPAVYATLSLLDEMGIDHMGGGKNITEAYRAWYAEKNGIKVSFLAVCENEFGGATDTKAGAAVFSMKRLCDRIAEEKQAALRNLFWCESHDTLMRGLLRLEYEGRLEEARASLPELLALQKIPE